MLVRFIIFSYQIDGWVFWMIYVLADDSASLLSFEY